MDNENTLNSYTGIDREIQESTAVQLVSEIFLQQEKIKDRLEPVLTEAHPQDAEAAKVAAQSPLISQLTRIIRNNQELLERINL